MIRKLELAASRQPKNRIDAIQILGVQNTLRAERMRALGWTDKRIAEMLRQPPNVIEKLLEGR